MEFKTGEMVWFEFSITEKSKMDFFHKLFGWTFTEFGENYWGINLESSMLGGVALIDKSLFKPVEGFVPYFTVPSVKEGAPMIQSLGGSLTGDIVAITGGDDGYYQKFKDLDGNQLAIWSKNP